MTITSRAPASFKVRAQVGLRGPRGETGDVTPDAQAAKDAAEAAASIATGAAGQAANARDQTLPAAADVAEKYPVIVSRSDQVATAKAQVSIDAAQVAADKLTAQSYAQNSGVGYFGTKADLLEDHTLLRAYVLKDATIVNRGMYGRATPDDASSNWVLLSNDTPESAVARVSVVESQEVDRPAFVSFQAGYGQPQWFGPALRSDDGSQYVLPMAVDLRNENTIGGARIPPSPQWPIIPDYLMAGHTHYEVEMRSDGTAFVKGYTDLNNQSWAYDPVYDKYVVTSDTSPLGDPQAILVAEMARGEMHREIILREQYRAGAFPPSPAFNVQGSAILSADVATYGNLPNQLIPAIKFTSGPRASDGVFVNRLWRINMGNILAPDTNPELPPVLARLSYVDVDKAAWAANPSSVSWNHVLFVLNNSNSVGVVDNMLTQLTDGRLVVMYTIWRPSDSSTPKTIRAFTVNNPLAVTGPGTVQTGNDCFLDWGFIGSPHVWGSEIRFFASDTINYPTETPPFAAYKGSRFKRLIAYGDDLTADTICDMPFMADLTAENYREPSMARVGPGRFLHKFRTATGQQFQYGTQDPFSGRIDWEPDFPWDSGAAPLFVTASAKTWMARSPSGRLVWMLNASSARSNMAVYLTDPGGDGTVWPYRCVIDNRYANGIKPFVTYPNGDFMFDVHGKYTGDIWYSYDCGRGHAPELSNEILTGFINENDIVALGSNAPFHTNIATL